MHRYPFVERLLRHWDARHVRYLPGVSETELQRFEDLNDLRLPPEFRACYLATNGVRVPGSPETDDKGYDFWPLHELRRVKGDPLKVYFADFQEGSWSFAELIPLNAVLFILWLDHQLELLPRSNSSSTSILQTTTRFTQPSGTSAKSNEAEPVEGGDPVCWLHLVCESCGALLKNARDLHRFECEANDDPRGRRDRNVP